MLESPVLPVFIVSPSFSLSLSSLSPAFLLLLRLVALRVSVCLESSEQWSQERYVQLMH